MRMLMKKCMLAPRHGLIAIDVLLEPGSVPTRVSPGRTQTRTTWGGVHDMCMSPGRTQTRTRTRVRAPHCPLFQPWWHYWCDEDMPHMPSQPGGSLQVDHAGGGTGTVQGTGSRCAYMYAGHRMQAIVCRPSYAGHRRSGTAPESMTPRALPRALKPLPKPLPRALPGLRDGWR